MRMRSTWKISAALFALGAPRVALRPVPRALEESFGKLVSHAWKCPVLRRRPARTVPCGTVHPAAEKCQHSCKQIR
jgi:hypothetical protein